MPNSNIDPQPIENLKNGDILQAEHIKEIANTIYWQDLDSNGGNS